MTQVNQLSDKAGNQISAAVSKDPGGNSTPRVSLDSGANTYRYCGEMTPVATPTCVILLQGSAKVDRRVKGIRVMGAATAAGAMACLATRRSSAPVTLGSAALAAVTPGYNDSISPAPQSDTNPVSTIGTANITTQGTTAGVLGFTRIPFIALTTAATSGEAKPLIWPRAAGDGQSWVLRGAADYISIELNGGALPAGGVLDFEIEIEEAPLGS